MQRVTKRSGKRATKSQPTERWQLAVYETGSGKRPALDFLGDKKLPDAVREELLVTVTAVAEYGPTRFPTSTNRWRLMHKPTKKGEVDLSGVCEARDKHKNILYRLFCVLDRDAAKHGWPLPSLVLISGARKPVRTEMSQKEYKMVDRYRNDYLKTRRLAETDDLPEWWPEPEVP